MLTLWRPEREMARLSQNLDTLFQWPTPQRADFVPAVDIEEDKTGYLLHMDAPGISEKEIEIEINAGELVISGARHGSKDNDEDLSVLKRERIFGKFTRRFHLGDGIDAQKIEASYKNGVLTVKLPKSEQSKLRHIPVAVH